MIHRLPTSEILRPYVPSILSLMLKLLQNDNEENVLVCLRIIIELHKQYRPQFNQEIHLFLQLVKQIYSDLPTHMPKIFEPRPPIRVKDLKDVNLEQLLNETYTITPIQVEKKPCETNNSNYNLIPKGILSLKVLQELPIIVVLMYQIYKQYVHQEVSEFVPLIMTTISLQPSPVLRDEPTFNKEVYVGHNHFNRIHFIKIFFPLHSIPVSLLNFFFYDYPLRYMLILWVLKLKHSHFWHILFDFSKKQYNYMQQQW